MKLNQILLTFKIARIRSKTSSFFYLELTISESSFHLIEFYGKQKKVVQRKSILFLIVVFTLTAFSFLNSYATVYHADHRQGAIYSAANCAYSAGFYPMF